jgi:hypothetical protein
MFFSRFTNLLSSLVLFSAMFSPAMAQLNDPAGKEENNSIFNLPKINPSTDPPPPIVPTQPSKPEQIKNPVIIQGMVITDDGSPPPFGTVIERDCGWVVVKEILVDSGGYYSFRIGDDARSSGLFADASENYYRDTSERDTSGYQRQDQVEWFQELKNPEQVMGCVLQARHIGYQSSAARLGVEQRTGVIQVGTIIMYPMSRINGTSVSVTNMKAPKTAQKALNNGRKALQNNELDKAETFLASAIQYYPKYAEAWVELGWLYQARDRYEDARKAYKTALKADKLYVSPYIRLAQLAALEKKWKDSIEYSNEAISLDPISYPQAYYLNALAQYHMNQLDRAENSVNRGIRVDLEKKFPRLYLILANILTKKQDPAGSIEAMRQYLKLEPNAPDAGYIRSLMKETEKIYRASKETNLRNIK